MVYNTHKNDENRFSLQRLELFYLLVEPHDLVNRTLHQPDTVLDHIYEDGSSVITWLTSSILKLN